MFNSHWRTTVKLPIIWRRDLKTLKSLWRKWMWEILGCWKSCRSLLCSYDVYVLWGSCTFVMSMMCLSWWRSHPVHVHRHQRQQEAVQEEIWSAVPAGYSSPLLWVRLHLPQSLSPLLCHFLWCYHLMTVLPLSHHFIHSLFPSTLLLVLEVKMQIWVRTTLRQSEHLSVAFWSITSAREPPKMRSRAFWDTSLPLEMRNRWEEEDISGIRISVSWK